MTYDYHGLSTLISSHDYVSLLGKWDQVTGINSPLYRSPSDPDNGEDWKNTVRSIALSLEMTIAALIV